MLELTAEQATKAQEMPMEELRKLAMSEEEPETPAKKQKPSADTEVLDNSADAAEEEEPEIKIYRKVIENEDGSTDVYEAESLEDLVDKIAEGKRNAVIQLKRVQAEKHEIETKTAQQIQDENFVVGERFKKEPQAVLEEFTARAVQKQRDADLRSIAIQSRFVNTHLDYSADPENGNGDRLVAEFQRLNPNATEFTTEGLEKAYQNLKRDGLLVLKAEGAELVTEAEVEETQRTAETKTEATQRVSPKKGSTVSMKGAVKGTPKGSQLPSDDEAYKMPLEKLRELANAQLAKANAE